MPIKSLESYLFERKLVSTGSIEILQNATIGIDAEHYLSRIYTSKKEQFLSAIGGIPSSLKDYIQSDLKVFQECNIKPIFIIKGLNIQSQVDDLKVNELSSNEQHLYTSWNRISQKDNNINNNFPGAYGNNESFRSFTDPLPFKPMINDLIKLFIDHDIEYLVCPYDTSFQLSYLYQVGLIDSIYGSTDLLLIKIEKFILGMEFQSKDFRFIEKVKVLKELNLTDRQLLDLSIMVGCNLQPTTFPNLPPLPKPSAAQPYPQLSHFKVALDILYQYINMNGNPRSDLYGFIYNLNDERCTELYQKGFSSFKFIPILNKEGYVVMYGTEIQKLGLISNDDIYTFEIDEKKNEGEKNGNGEKNGHDKQNKIIQIPNDVHDIISQRLPPEFYFYLSNGLAPIELLEAITQGKLNIRPTLEAALSDSYKKLINSKEYIDNLDSLFNLLTQLLARYYQVKKIKVNYWYKDETLELNNRMNPNMNQQLKHLIMKTDKPDFKLTDFFINLNDSFKETKDIKLTSNNDVISTGLLRSFYLIGLIDKKTNQLTSYGKGLKTFITKHKTSNDIFQQLILLLLLIKSDVLKLNEPNREFSSVARHFKDVSSSTVDQEDLKHITLVSRIFSIHKINIAPINYQGPISRNLLNFRSHLKFISKNLIYTLQSCLIDLIVRQENNNLKVDLKSKNDWNKFIGQIPFFKDINNTLLGVIAEIYFEYSLKQKKLNKDLSKEQIIENTQDQLLNSVYQINNTVFNINVHGVNSITASQLLADFQKGVEFWNLFIDFVKVFNETDKSIISDDYLKSILETDEWMKQFV